MRICAILSFDNNEDKVECVNVRHGERMVSRVKTEFANELIIIDCL